MPHARIFNFNDFSFLQRREFSGGESFFLILVQF